MGVNSVWICVGGKKKGEERHVTFRMASTQRHEARGDEVVEVGAAAAPDALFPVVETWWHTEKQAWRVTTDKHTDRQPDRHSETLLTFWSVKL